MSLSLDHHFYADDIQLFFTFHPPNFDSSISHLQNALQQISSWMTANLLTINSLRLNSCSSDLKNNLPKYTYLHLTPPTLLKILALSYILTLCDQIASLSKVCYYHIRQLQCIRPYLEPSTAYNTATSVVHSKLDYSNSLCYKLSFRLQHVQNSLACTVLSYHSHQQTPL